ncbi:hypothetical protein PILCRDRAFT_6949 [Piloderma croceum F 1598]|uniref:Uncharacterized protein n=1 Tax=Piloderma croceum (strain F 1598) TaxID=765440 RepID=A0A0C3BB53_PILCF|nr:hypothetical protein PILCRDRAFT_6949 [Piloderma croceum F 1598]
MTQPKGPTTHLTSPGNREVWLGFGTGLSCPFFEYFGDRDEWRATVDGTAGRGINLCDRDNKGQRPEDDHSTFKYSKEAKLRKMSLSCPAESDSGDENHDKTYKPKKTPPNSEEESSGLEAENSDIQVEIPSSKDKKPKKKAKTITYISDGDTDITVEEIQGMKVGRNPVKAQWAFSLWTPRPAFDKQKPVWKWGCNHCPKYRCTPRTAVCKKYENEILKCPPSSNFISHSLKCKFVPATESWPAFEAPRNTGSVGGDGGSTVITRGIEAQRSFMDGFSACGIDNPAKAVTGKGFREHLVKGIIEDDLPYSLGEKAGMLKLFEYVLPRGIATPSHQTVRRDLDILYEQLDERLNKELKSNNRFLD